MRNRIITCGLTATLLFASGCSSTRTPTTETKTNSSITNISNTNVAQSSGAGSTSQNSPELSSAAGGTIKSIYTELNGKGCSPERETDEVSSERTCAGIEGYKLLVENNDARDTITIITPDGRQHPLNFSQTISNGGFAEVGQKAEWRVVNRNGKDVPIALIARVDVQTGDSNKPRSYLSVSKISEQGICVTDRIDPAANANEKAREAADAAANKPCLPGGQ